MSTRSSPLPAFPSVCTSYARRSSARNEWNPADYAVHLSRRARGLPFWFSLAVHGTDAYAEAIDPISDVRGSAAYRRRVIAVEVRRAVEGLSR